MPKNAPPKGANLAEKIPPGIPLVPSYDSTSPLHIVSFIIPLLLNTNNPPAAVAAKKSPLLLDTDTLLTTSPGGDGKCDIYKF